MKRITTVLVLGVMAAGVAYYVLSRPTTAPLADRHEYAEYTARTEKDAGLAPVQPWWEESPEIQSQWRARKAVRLMLVHGEVFDGDHHLPREKIRGFLDDLVSKGEIDYVILFPARDTRWGEIFPALDECRKSHVRIVLLNQYES
jgi:hypothetical protein